MLLNSRQFVNRNSEMKMWRKFPSFLVLLWIFEVNSQLLNYPGLNGGCTNCQSDVHTTGSYYGNYPWYPQYRQVGYQYPSFGQYYSQYLPYAYANNQLPQAGSQQINSNVNRPSVTKTTDNSKFANVKTEVIDIDPQYFRYLYSRYLPQSVSVPKSRKVSVSNKRFPYVVKVDSHQYNSSNIPQVIKKHDVQHKTFTFKKTYVLTPGNENSVINLNFVNGVPVTTVTSNDLREETTLPPSTTTEESTITTEEPTTTTENDNPVSVTRWYS